MFPTLKTPCSIEKRICTGDRGEIFNSTFDMKIPIHICININIPTILNWPTNCSILDQVEAEVRAVTRFIRRLVGGFISQQTRAANIPGIKLHNTARKYSDACSYCKTKHAI